MRMRTAGVGFAVAALLAAAGLLAGVPRTRRVIRAALEWNVRRQRARSRPDGQVLRHLAASQIGYGPAMEKRFSSPRPFGSFQVVRESDRAVVFAGQGPTREIRTDAGPAGTVSIGDFSALSVPGRYLIEAGGLESQPFDIGPGIFDLPLRAVQRAFYFQRAFTAIDAAHAEGPWIHPSDAGKAPPGVRMGWHDAGDFSIYSASLNTALFWMLEAYSDFTPRADDTGIPESGNGVPNLLDEARWGLEWLLSVQGASGGFRNSTCAEQYGPYGTNFPNRVAPYRSGEVGTLATARAVGSLAYASVVFRPFDETFARRALEAARRGESYLRSRPGEASDGPTCPAYRADGDVSIGRQVRMYAAAGMLLATGEPRFRDDFESEYVELDGDPSYLHMNGFAARLYLRAAAGDEARKSAIRGRLRARAEWARREGEQHPFGLSAPTHWGSIGAGFTRVDFSSAHDCLEDPAGAAADCSQALADLHYALGRNSLGICYVSGLPGAARPHTRAFHHWLASLRAEPFLFPGMVAGGPNAAPEPADSSNPLARPIPIWGYWDDPAFPRDASTPQDQRYTDNDSWSTNEISIDWQSSALYAFHFARWMARRAPAQ